MFDLHKNGDEGGDKWVCTMILNLESKKMVENCLQRFFFC